MHQQCEADQNLLQVNLHAPARRARSLGTALCLQGFIVASKRSLLLSTTQHQASATVTWHSCLLPGHHSWLKSFITAFNNTHQASATVKEHCCLPPGHHSCFKSFITDPYNTTAGAGHLHSTLLSASRASLVVQKLHNCFQ